MIIIIKVGTKNRENIKRKVAKKMNTRKKNAQNAKKIKSIDFISLVIFNKSELNM